MTSRDLILGEAELDDEENDQSFDEENGSVKEPVNGVNGKFHDSSEEEESDDDEDAAREIREGFIDDEDEEEAGERERRRHRHKKRRRAEKEREEEVLDEEDLDLIGENDPAYERRVPSEPKFKRLKRGHKEDRHRAVSRGLDEMFSDDEGESGGIAPHEVEQDRLGRFRPERRGLPDEFEDFIEQDELTDDDEKARRQEELEVARPKAGQSYTGVNAEDSGLNEETLETMMQAFGDGEEYKWALEMEEDMEEQELADQQLELKDVFEPSQLAEKLLTDDDNLIRWADEPERFQIARKPFKHVVLTDDQFKEEALWISNLMLPKKRLARDLIEPFQKAIGKVLEFFVTDEVEVPFVFQHRKDYLIHAAKVQSTPDPRNPDAPEYVVGAEKLLVQSDLWQVLELDLKFRALIEKRNTLQRTFDNLSKLANVHDEIFDTLLPKAETMEELQDIQDYMHMEHSTHLKDIQALNGQVNGTQRRPVSQKSLFERIRNGKVYNLVRAYGITADAFAENAMAESGRRRYDTEDPSKLPDDMADEESVLDPPEFATGAQAMKAARLMFAKEISTNPKMRKVMRRAYYLTGVVECFRTEKGLRKIDEQHAYYEFKYLRNQQMSDIAMQPDMYLRMLKAEEEGLVEVKIRLQGGDNFRKSLISSLVSDNFSEIADAWNEERERVLDMALTTLHQAMTKNVKEHLKTQCEDEIVNICREEFSKRLDQAPFKPPGEALGSAPRVLALSCGTGQANRDAVCWAWVEDDGRVLENGKFNDLRYDEKAKDEFVELVERRRPDAIAVSGFSVETHRLRTDIINIVDSRDLRGSEFDDPETGQEMSRKLDVVMVNDEVARLYYTSDRASTEHPGLAPLTRYCIALARYMLNPMKEYAALGRDIASITFHPSQQLVSQEKLLTQLETAMVDMVNLCGIDINEAVGDSYTANLLPYICGLGPRKATSVLKAINANGGVVSTRDELVGDPEENKLPVVGPRVWNNCASFVYIEYDASESTSDYLDHTRVHPEDYELGRKMAADALELDEEDVKAEIDEAGPAAIVRKLIKDDASDKVNDLILEEYAEQLEQNFNQKKRATLETIRAELQQPYEELRRNFALMSDDEIFTMLTGETRDSLCKGMVVPISIKKVLRNERKLEAVLDCGVRGFVDEDELPIDRDIDLNQVYSLHQTVQAKILSVRYEEMEVILSLREDQVQRPYRKQLDRMPDEWDEEQEDRDRDLLQEKSKETGRTQRVIKHPLFRNFNSLQAEEYLGSQARGDAVIRPSSKGPDHIAITWKVSDNVYQHLDVLELDKENEFSVGRTLKIGGRYTYSDLDELIVNHVKAMARKVDEITLHEKFQGGSKSDTERWLTTYTEANPKRSVYAFCIDPKHPGYFFLCFKAGQHAMLATWSVKIIPQAFELRNNAYPDMRALCNGFKLLFGNMQNGRR
ncbi:MAG: Transcription elongation factor spt6 [Sclerophora amabilis]|nr:MAG: Transcription elongation factor spt6 [Sclerophora amabilis]